ncbi:MAG: glycosyltransferase [Bacteroidota bacterium]
MQLKKKILLCVTNDISYDQRMQRIGESLFRAGYEVELIGRLLPNSKPVDTAFPFKTTRLKCTFNKGKLFYIEYNIRLLLYLVKQNFDAICAVDFDTLLAAKVATGLQNKILVFDAHEHFTEVPEVTNRPFTKWIWHKLGKLLVPYAKLCYTVGPQLADILSKTYHHHFKFIMNVPAVTKQTSEPVNSAENFAASPKIILYQGALNESRGLEQSILAMHQITNAQLLIAGEGDLSASLRELVQTEKLSDKVIFLGYLTPTELKKYTQKAAVGLNLLEPVGLSYYYSLANKYFDYMQAGVPCVCANFPEYQHINQQYACSVLTDCEVTAIASAINNLLNNWEQYEQLSKNCLKASEAFNWAIEEQKLIDYYRQVI